jgi:benzil reductase ((S)-benzoin forming)
MDTTTASHESPAPQDPDTLVVVTGGSGGLGRALLETAPAGSYRVDVSRSGPPAVADEHVTADLADPASWPLVGRRFRELVEARAWRRITFVHNAGILEPLGFAGEVDGDAYTRNVLLNAAAPQVLGAYVLEAMADGAATRELVMISSGASSKAVPGWTSYAAAKAAVDQWVRVAGEEQRMRGGVRVIAIAPGVVATGMQDLIRSTDERDFPQVGRFHDLYERGELLEPVDAARGLWAVLADPDVTTGTVTDVRDR